MEEKLGSTVCNFKYYHEIDDSYLKSSEEDTTMLQEHALNFINRYKNLEREIQPTNTSIKWYTRDQKNNFTPPKTGVCPCCGQKKRNAVSNEDIAKAFQVEESNSPVINKALITANKSKTLNGFLSPNSNFKESVQKKLNSLTIEKQLTLRQMVNDFIN